MEGLSTVIIALVFSIHVLSLYCLVVEYVCVSVGTGLHLKALPLPRSKPTMHCAKFSSL